MSSELAVAEAIVTEYAARGGVPGIAYGIVRDGELVRSGGVGVRRLGGEVPDAGTVFRIASMTKSFTASAVLLLRDAGLLALDDPAARYVPELGQWGQEAPEGGARLGGGVEPAQPVSIRHLLTMTAGFPTDDPWGDRQQGLPLAGFAAFLAGGVTLNWAPGTRFEYSNLGYAILGRVISAASGTPYADFIRSRLLEPLGLARTGFEASEFAPATLAAGYRRSGAGWQQVPYDGYGAFAPMGGVFSCVRDLATWVSGFASAFPPGSPPSSHPLAAASRREMQLPGVLIPSSRGHSLPGGPLGAPGTYGPSSYGLGLFVDEVPGLGRVVSHSGGYPGFGSNMRWHPASGTGVIALGNATYAPMTVLTSLLLDAIVARRPATYQLALAPASPGGGPWPRTLAAREAVSALVASVAGTEADQALFTGPLFTENVALDRPPGERVADIALLRERIGAIKDADRPFEHDTPAHCRWFLAGEHGQVVQAQIQLSPERPPRVQSLALAIPPAAASPLEATLDAVIALLNSGAPAWPETIAVAPGVDVGLLARRLRMAAAWTGTVSPGAFRAGDGASSVSVELSGEHAPALLTLLVDSSAGTLRAADITL